MIAPNTFAAICFFVFPQSMLTVLSKIVHYNFIIPHPLVVKQIDNIFLFFAYLMVFCVLLAGFLVELCTFARVYFVAGELFGCRWHFLRLCGCRWHFLWLWLYGNKCSFRLCGARGGGGRVVRSVVRGGKQMVVVQQQPAPEWA